jgi:hypothetical protein
MNIKQEFRNYATKHQGLNGTTVDDVFILVNSK